MRRRVGFWLRLGSSDPFVCVVPAGLLRTFLVSADGRQMTVRYSRRGDIVGAATLFAGQLPNTGVQAIVDSSVLVLRPQTVLGLAATDVGLANVLLHDVVLVAAERDSSPVGPGRARSRWKRSGGAALAAGARRACRHGPGGDRQD